MHGYMLGLSNVSHLTSVATPKTSETEGISVLKVIDFAKLYLPVAWKESRKCPRVYRKVQKESTLTHEALQAQHVEPDQTRQSNRTEIDSSQAPLRTPVDVSTLDLN